MKGLVYVHHLHRSWKAGSCHLLVCYKDPILIPELTKGGFFQKERFVFQIFKSPKKLLKMDHYPELEI